MRVLDAGRRWVRRYRARRLRRRARSRSPADLGEGAVDALEQIAKRDDGRGRFLAVEGLEAVARDGRSDPVRAAATDALFSVLERDDEALQGATARSLRYVALEREAVVARLDPPYAEILDQWDHAAHGQVAVDAGMVLSRPTYREDLPETRAVLRECLVGGTPAARRSVAVAYVLCAEAPDRFDDPGTLAEHLAILDGELDPAEQLPSEGSSAREFADGRTLTEAVEAFSRVAN